MKKTILGLGALATVVTPVVAVVSCGQAKISDKVIGISCEAHSYGFSNQNDYDEIQSSPKMELKYNISYDLNKNDDNPTNVFYVLTPKALKIEGIDEIFSNSERESINESGDSYYNISRQERIEFLMSLLDSPKVEDYINYAQDNVTLNTKVFWTREDGKSFDEFLKNSKLMIVNNWIDSHPLRRQSATEASEKISAQSGHRYVPGTYVDWKASTSAELRVHTKFVAAGGLINDHTFNQEVHDAVSGVLPTVDSAEWFTPMPIAESTSEQLIRKYEELQRSGAKLIVAPGYEHVNPLMEFASKHPEMAFLSIDGSVDGVKTLHAPTLSELKKIATAAPYYASEAEVVNHHKVVENGVSYDVSIKQGNVASITFKVGQAAFLEGVAAAYTASYGNHHKIGIYGGMKIKSVQDYINGFLEGVAYWNAHNGPTVADVTIVGSGSNRDIEYVGNFDVGGDSAAKADKIVKSGVDLIMAVGGAQYQDAFEAAKKAKNGTKVIGVDVDIQSIYADTTRYGYDANDKDYIFGSITKDLKKATADALTAIYTDEATARTYIGKVHVGDLKSNEVGITNSQDFSDAVAVMMRSNPTSGITETTIREIAQRLSY